MALTLSLSQRDAELIGFTELEQLIAGYAELYPDHEFLADVILLEPEPMQNLNRAERGIDEPTDVLSFPTFPDLAEIIAQTGAHDILIGSIAICPVKATAYNETLIQLVHHGLMHLLGFDHEKRLSDWEAEEKRILDTLERHNLVIPPIPDDSI